MQRRSDGSRTVMVGRAVRRALSLSLAIGLLSSALQAQISVEELEVHLQLQGTARNTLAQIIPIKNDQDRPLQVRARIASWYRDSLGRNVFIDSGQVEGACGDRLQVFPVNLQVAPGAREVIRVAYAPEANDAGCWSIVMIETLEPPPLTQTREGSFLAIEVRTGVKVYVHAADRRKAGEVVGAEMGLFWRRVDPQSRTGDTTQVREAVVRFANTGPSHLRVKTILEIRNSDAQLVEKIEGLEYPMTPGAVLDIHAAVPAKLPAGDYIAILLLDYGGDEIHAAQIDFRIP